MCCNVSLYFSVQLNTLGGFCFPTNTNIKNRCRSKVGAVRQCLRTRVDVNPSPTFIVGTSVLKFCTSILEII